ncbi:hypothetical protein B1F69_14275 [Pseudomonas syringae]|uniref:hypothetical protein n=1 Tax=Pseudomonas syringae TaxID=317 RepID=UPI001012D3E5|nr:hypothetical protein [Pseudomonas syringae]RXT91380.1 hypothetical protein B1F69_14275 [Pseudomonas syringae]
MTLAVLWYRKDMGQLWCAADSRLSKVDGVITDCGPKIIPVPIVCYKYHKDESQKKWLPESTHSFGFAFAGSSLAALSTHAIVCACTQALTIKGDVQIPVSVEEISKLFVSVGERQVLEMSERLGALDSAHSYFFDFMVFGYCPREHKAKAFVGVSSLVDSFHINVAELLIGKNNFFVIGSGEQEFVRLIKEADGMPGNGVMTALNTMLKQETRADVGGNFQIGVVDKKGFRLAPILDTSNGLDQAKATFLGMDVTSLSFEGYGIGYEAIKI